MNWMKFLTQAAFTAVVGICGNVAAAFIVADVWSNVFTQARLWGTAAALIGALLALAALESNALFLWNWWWHQFWYRRAMLSDVSIGRWAEHFSVLNFRRRQRPILRADAKRDGSSDSHPLVQTLKQEVLAGDRIGKRVLVVGEPGSGKTSGLETVREGVKVEGTHQGIP